MTLADDPTTLSGARIAELRRAASDAGIAITGLHYVLRAPAGLSITSADDAVRERTIEVMRALCGLCAELGGKILVHGSPDQRRLEPGDEDDGRKRGIDCFAGVADAAQAAGVDLLHRAAGAQPDRVRQYRAGGRRDRAADRQSGAAHHDRLLGRRSGREPSRSTRWCGAGCRAG